MKSKTVKMVLAVAVLAVSCGAYAGVKNYVSVQETQTNEAEEDTSTSVVSVSQNEIKSVGFLIDKKEVVFEKDGDSWVKQDEKEFPVNQTMIENAVSSVSSIETDRVLEDVENLEQYGLSNPSNTIKIETTETTEITLRIGDKNESAGQYYVSKDDDRNTVYLVNSAIVEPFMKELYDYAQMEDFPAISGIDTVKKISITGETITPYELEKEEETGFWKISGDMGSEKADSAEASSLATSLSSLAYDSFIDYNCEDKGKYGLDQPYAVINVDYQEEVAEETEEDESADANEDGLTENEETTGAEAGESEGEMEPKESTEPEMVDKQLAIVVGDEAAEGGRYVSVNGSNQIYTMSEAALSTFLGKSEADFWDLTVSYASVNTLEELKVCYQNSEHVINVSRETSQNKNGEEEEIVTYLLDEKEIDEVKFVTFYNKLINIVGQRRLTESFEPDADPEMTVRFSLTDGAEMEVEYYAYDTNYYAAVVSEKVYLVNKMNVKAMVEAFETVIERTAS